MNRKGFLKNTILGLAGITAGAKLVKAENKDQVKSTYDKLMQQVGFNHLPNNEIKTMKSVLHKANSRGHANHGWLQSNHTFSFANYHNPDRMNFGVLRVLNDDTVAPGRGFGTHPHDNMEIISIPLEGDLEHKDSMGNVAVIKQGDLQVMSAGTGIYHSEYNKHGDRQVKFLQIWLFPNKRDVTPRYDQISFDSLNKRNELVQVLSPNPGDAGVWIHQNAWFNMVNLDQDRELSYTLNDNQNNGVYVFVIEGDVTVEGQKLNPRDGFGLWDIDKIKITGNSEARLLLMEVPMRLS